MGSGLDPMEDGLEVFGGRACLADSAGGLLAAANGLTPGGSLEGLICTDGALSSVEGGRDEKRC